MMTIIWKMKTLIDQSAIGEVRSIWCRHYISYEGRLKNLADHRSDDLRQEFERLDMLMLSVLVRASMRFFFVLSANPILPLGAREIFVSELRSLHDAHTKLNHPNYAGKLNPELEKELETASLILEEIIDKAPGLLQFS